MRLGLGHVPFIYIYLFSILFSPVNLALVNVTVDDSGQDPVTNRTIIYGPGWSGGQNCDTCSVTSIGGLDPGETYQRSWHDSSYLGDSPHFATFVFYGFAIYVFGILANNKGSWVPNIDLQFYIDGRLMSTFQQSLPDQLAYNVSYFGIKDLTNGEHLLTIFNGEVGKNQSLALIDYLVYSYDPENTTGTGTPAPVPSNVASLSVGTIVGGTIGGALAFILLFASAFFCLRRRQQVHALAAKLLPFHHTRVTPFSRASGGSDLSVKSRLRGTQNAVEPPPYTTEISLTGAAISSRSFE
ncbi:hypothetical protein P691DRAFT_805740 [Macrolepiota fuliginosa MF-IS2]|uniref:Epidermal growth factor receptor-like transmembrane-juxtamembrane segment domain-containing protein n=1 Tax=Macrolepiota fuliginosa MF-IS2 TaxID=1400762 RepID=A0A9P5X8M5_9AGAR|nr:hypothetical protein P691DRAFT_805740 [Macrolepiota fuliginosa MF-IS2]